MMRAPQARHPPRRSGQSSTTKPMTPSPTTPSPTARRMIPRLSKSMHRSFNFSAGPAALPLEVLEHAAAELYDYKGTGMSVMEMSHRSAEFIDIAQRAERDLRDL